MKIGFAGPVDLLTLSQEIPAYRPSTNGLASPLLTSIVQGLLDRGHEVTVFTLSGCPEDQGWFEGDHLSLFVGPFRRRARWVDAFGGERRALADAMTAHPCDIIHAHWTYEFALAAMRSGTPHLVTVHDWGPQVLRYQKHPYRAVRLGMQAKVIAGTDHLTANSPYIAERVRRWFRREIPVIPNGIVVPLALPKRENNEVPTIGALNNGFGARKNATALLEAFSQVRKSFPDAMLCLVGTDYEQDGPAHTWAVERWLDVGVEFRGPIPASEVPAFMRSLDLFVHPSLEESFGLVLIEAIIEGTPVIGGAQSGAVPWVLGQGEAGVLADVGDPDAIADEIVRALGSPQQLRELAERALNHTRENFSLRHVVDLYEAEYDRILTSV